MGRVMYNQNGYCGCSMSTRAVIAYESGERPKSRWTKQAMLEAIERCCHDEGIAYDATKFRFTKAELFNRFFEWTSWHHTGKYANVTDFFGVDAEAVIERLEGTE